MPLLGLEPCTFLMEQAHSTQNQVHHHPKLPSLPIPLVHLPFLRQHHTKWEIERAIRVKCWVEWGKRYYFYEWWEFWQFELIVKFPRSASPLTCCQIQLTKFPPLPEIKPLTCHTLYQWGFDFAPKKGRYGQFTSRRHQIGGRDSSWFIWQRKSPQHYLLIVIMDSWINWQSSDWLW